MVLFSPVLEVFSAGKGLQVLGKNVIQKKCKIAPRAISSRRMP